MTVEGELPSAQGGTAIYKTVWLPAAQTRCEGKAQTAAATHRCAGCGQAEPGWQLPLGRERMLRPTPARGEAKIIQKPSELRGGAAVCGLYGDFSLRVTCLFRKRFINHRFLKSRRQVTATGELFLCF